MKIKRFVALGAAGVLLAMLLPNVPASAQERPALTVDPTTGSIGTAVTVSGGGCVGEGGVAVDVALDAPAPAPPADYEAAVTFADAEIAPDGSWTAEFVIPSTYPVPDGDGGTVEVDVVPGDGYKVIATCRLGSGPETQYIQYEDVPFEVTAGSSTAVLPITVDPTQGPIGTTIRVSGSDCVGGEIEFALLAGTGLDDATGVIDGWVMSPATDGTWSGELLVYDTAILFTDDIESEPVEVDVVPGADYFVVAACAFYPEDVPEAPFPDEVIFSDPVDFEVTGGGTAPPRTDPPEVPSFIPLTPVAQPASAVPGDPNYTG
jgi:hypothetical protein